MVNISPTIKLDILVKLGVTENILLGASYTFEEVETYKVIFQEFHGMFSWSCTKILCLNPAIMEHHIDT